MKRIAELQSSKLVRTVFKGKAVRAARDQVGCLKYCLQALTERQCALMASNKLFIQVGFFRVVPYHNLPSIFTEQRTTVQGQVYFLHTQTGVSTWHDPRIPRYVFLATNSGPWGGFCACTDVSWVFQSKNL